MANSGKARSTVADAKRPLNGPKRAKKPNAAKQAAEHAVKHNKLARIDEALSLYKPRLEFA